MTDEQIKKEMTAAREDVTDLFNAAFFGIKGKNSIYNETIDKVYGGKSPWRNHER